MDKYESVREIEAGNFGVTKLMRNRETRELVAMKFIERGNTIDDYVFREIVNHRSLHHPNIIRFNEVVLTPTHLAIAMEYAAGGELFERICNAGRFSEDEARYFFQQLVCGVSFCHAMTNICHRDMTVGNTLLDGSPAPRLKICNFRYSKSWLLHSRPKSTVGTPGYIAPEVLSRREYDGKQADVWSCGVALYVMLVGAYPFEDPKDPMNFKETISRIVSVQYKIPEYVHVSQDCRHLLSSIFVQDPAKRITMSRIMSHPWYLKNLPHELKEEAQAAYYSRPAAYRLQSVQEIIRIVHEAQTVPKPARPVEEAEQVEMENIHMEFDSLESILGGRERPRNLKLPFLKFITKNFSSELIIGIGGCGVVYKGILRNHIIAVKRLLNSHTIDDKMFHGEVKSLMMVNHENVVRFLGYCSNTEEQALKMQGNFIMAQDRERLLCFEYLINGNLESYLTDELRGLDWQTRYQLIKGICDGLHHLHTENGIIHMDLKPANILLDSNMVPKITDFGLSRLDNISQTMSSERLVSLGYCAPEYQYHGKMSAKSDIYSLGVIILELVTGTKEEPNITKVHRRWKHRWNKTTKDAQLGYKQVATCLDLVGRCIQIDPTHRPNIWDIISYLNELDSSDAKISDGTECLELDDMLGVEPLEIHLPFEPTMQTSRSVELTNDTDDHFAFRVSTTSLRPYCIEENEGTVPPRSKCSVTISMQALDRALPFHQCRDEFCAQSSRVDGSLAATNLGGDIFNEEPGKVIDTVNFSVVLIEASSPSANHRDEEDLSTQKGSVRVTSGTGCYNYATGQRGMLHAGHPCHRFNSMRHACHTCTLALASLGFNGLEDSPTHGGMEYIFSTNFSYYSIYFIL